MIINQRGISLVQTVMTMAISVISVAAIAGIMSKTFSVSRELDIQALMDSRHADLLHRASSLNFLRSHFQVGDAKVSALESCLKGTGTSCGSFVTAAKELKDSQDDFNAYYGLKQGKCTQISSDCVVRQNAVYTWICPSSNECTELKLNLQTSYLGQETRKLYKNRVNEILVPARSLTSRGDIDFSCTVSGMLMGVNYKDLKGLCAPISGIIQTRFDLPAKSLGTNMEEDPGVRDCAKGLSEVGLFSSGFNCGMGEVPSDKKCVCNGDPDHGAQCFIEWKASGYDTMNKCLSPCKISDSDVNCASWDPYLGCMRQEFDCLAPRKCFFEGTSTSCVQESSRPNGLPEPGVCTPTRLEELNGLLVQTISRNIEAIARNCIDEVNPTLVQNLPATPMQTLRFKNTCGNRQCRSMGYSSGRVVELYNGTATLECRRDKVPDGMENPCASLIAGSAAPMQRLHMSQSTLQNECIDAVHPTAESNNPDLGAEAASRFFLVCGARACLSRGFSDGRVTELFGGALELECYKDLAKMFKDLNASVDDIARNCIDGAVTTLEENRPSTIGSTTERFMSTCGNRYCIKMGYRSGSVVEHYAGAATLRCIQ